MKSNLFSLLLFIALGFCFFAVVTNSQSSLFSCTGCDSGMCNCATACVKGTVAFFYTTDCSLFPYRDFTFSNGNFYFSVNKTMYLEMFCDSGDFSSCITIIHNPNLENPDFSCAHCDSGTCICGVSGCDKGLYYFYSSIDCSTIPYDSGSFSGSTFTFSTNKVVAMKVYCDNGHTTPCNLVPYHAGSTTTSVSTTTSRTTTTSFTTTSISQPQCPYQCCSNDENYLDRYCDDGYECINHICQVTTTTTTALPLTMNYSLIASSFIALCLMVFLLYYILGIVVMRSSRRAS
jgi:hypothetical protein